MYLDDAVLTIASFEGRINWMYLDTTGNVTAGVGQCLHSPDEALLYPFKRQNAEFATHEEIVAQFHEIKAMPPGLKALAYRRFESLLLSNDDIDTMLRAELFRCASELAAVLPDFHEYPDAAKVGLIDMRFNLGLVGLRMDFPQFWRAVRERRWDAAAAQCHRIGPSEERNAWTQERFTLAALEPAEARI